MEVSPYYDPLLAKLIVWGPDRASAINRMQRALAELFVGGVPTSQPFHVRMLANEQFLAADFHVQFLENEAAGLMDGAPESRFADFALAAALAERFRSDASAPQFSRQDGSGWKAAARREGLR